MNISHAAKKIALLLIVVLLAACESNNKKELEPAELEPFDAEIEIDTLWTRKIGSGMGEYYHQFSLAADSGFLYAASRDGAVFKLDKLSGKKQWKVSLDVDLTTGVGIDADHAYVGAIDGTIIALDKKNGEQVWAVHIPGEIVSPPVIFSNHLVVLAANGEVFSLDSATGKQRWQFDGNMPTLTLRGNSRATFLADFVVVGQANGKLAVLDLETGQLRWEPKVATPQGDSEIERIVDVDSTPLFIQDKLYAVSYQGQIVAYDMKSGRLLWADDESSYRDIYSGFGNVYVTSDSSQVTAYDQSNGKIRWVDESLLRRRLTAPVVVSSYLALADYEGYVHLLSQIDGRMVARKRVGWSGIKTDILADGSRFYVIADNGKLKAFELGAEIK